MSFHVGIDVGGTFTDVCVAGADGVVSIHKTPTLPDIAEGVLNGLVLAAEGRGLSVEAFLGAVERFGHGSTVAVNALLQRRGVKTGLITTRGFGDTLWIARMMAMTTGLPPEKITHYRNRQRPDPLVERHLVREVAERVDFRGDVIVALDEDAARAAIRELLDAGIAALAICTLWSFRNPVHERMVRALALEMAPELYVTTSSELVPVMKEYERSATTVVNAYLGPVVETYLQRMRNRLRDAGLPRGFLMLNSVGGVMPPEDAGRRAVQLLGSGPCGGAMAAQSLARRMGEANVLVADMGGTSFDAGLIADGELLVQTETSVGNLNLLNPMIGIRSIGTGGGSIARAADGLLKVGPESAGAHPGPACYGGGGTQPTVTDANLVLGYLNPDWFLGGRMALDREAALRAIETQVAQPLGMSVFEAAAGIREVAEQQMADLLRQTTLERGYDPREFCLFAYGGAGPVHACGFGREAGVKAIVVPATASVFSAQGILSADLRLSRQQSVLQRSRGTAADRAAGLDGAALERVFATLQTELEAEFLPYRPEGTQHRFLRSVSMRFSRQVHEVSVPVGETLDAAEVVGAFDRVYQHRFGRGTFSPSAVIEIVSCHVQLIGSLAQPELAVAARPGAVRPRGTRRVFSGDWVDVPVYRWDDLPLRARIAGPVLIDGTGTTVFVAADFVAQTDEQANLRMEQAT
jgi:N-methylhydantoinase A